MRKFFLFFIFLTVFVSCGENSEPAIDKCKDVTCSGHGTCLVVNNTATCNCETGYHSDGLNCVTDVVDLCENVTCDSWKSCNSTNGLCELKINRCDIQSDCSEEQICDENHNCINSVNPCEGVICSNHGTCSVENELATCNCENGYDADGLSCVDINECENNTHNCQEGFECINTIGSFSCEEIDLCKNVTCSNHGTCSVVNELATCNCENGYDVNGLNCVDINECINETDNCHENADCINSDGSFSCECKTGFSGNGLNCSDINECENNTHNCQEGFECINSIGSFSCREIDLCEGITCSGHGTCSVVNNTAICTCDVDYQSNGLTCIALYNCDTDNMCLIPAGNFIMGKNEINPSNHSPEREVYLNSYKMDRYEVTVAKFRECVDAGICTSDKFKTNLTYSKYNYGGVGRDNHPMNGVNWHGAKDYCQWVGKRLPTEAEWEKAAKGTDNRTYPWGTNNPTCNISVMYDCYSATIEVGSKPIGISPYGIYDMSGNVSEWVSDWFNITYYSLGENNNPTGPLTGNYKVKRGGSVFKNYISPAFFGLTVFSRNYSDPSDISSDISENGFRCVKDVN